jgi:cobalt-zinc-cadmium efflux system protein
MAGPHHHRHDHDHDHHHHSHESHPAGDAERRAGLAFALTAGFMVVEAAGGWLSGSLALLADAAHMLTDALALALTWGAFRIGRRAPDPQRTYGYRRFEVLAALGNGVTVIALAAVIAWEAVQRLSHPAEVIGLPMLVVAVVGLLVNLVVLRFLHGSHGRGPDNLNLRGAALHVVGDLLGSVGAVGAALVILGTGWTPIDPILSVGVAALILVNAWQLLRSATHILLEGTPEGFDPERVRTALETVPGVAGVHHIHAWSLTSGQPLVSLHVTLAPEAEPDVVLAEVKGTLSLRFALAHSVVQIEHGGCPDGPHACA